MFCFSSFYSVEPKVCFSFGISLFVLKYMWGWWVAVLLPIRFSWTQKSCASLHPYSPKTPELLSKTQELSPAPYLWTAMSPHQLGPPAGPGPSPHAWAVPLLAEAVEWARLPAPDISIHFNKLFPIEYVERCIGDSADDTLVFSCEITWRGD